MTVRIPALLLLAPALVFAQGGRGITAHNAANENKTYDKHDLSGIWSRNGSPGGYGGGGTCRDCGDSRCRGGLSREGRQRFARGVTPDKTTR